MFRPISLWWPEYFNNQQMLSKSVSGKDGIVSELHRINKKLDELFPKLNTIDSILTLMSFVDSLDNESHHVKRLKIQSQNHTDEILNLMENNIIFHRMAIYDCISHLHSHSNHKRTLSKVPPIVTLSIISYVTNPYELSPEILDWILDNFNLKTDIMFFIPTKLGNKVEATRIVFLQEYRNISGNEQITLTMDFLRNFYTKKALQGLLAHNINANVSPGGSTMDLVDLSPEEMMKEGNFHPRKLESFGANEFPYWKGAVRELGEQTVLSTELSANSPKQKEMFAKEHRTFYDQFVSIPGFTQKFFKETGVSLDDYREITLALERLALDHDPPVIFLPIDKVVRKVKKKCGCSEESIMKVLSMFTCEPRSEMDNKRILVEGRDCLYTYCMIPIPFQEHLMDIRRSVDNGNFQGPAFEDECRKALIRHSYSVVSERIDIHQQTMPNDVSIRLLGRVKKGTDIDVIGVKECCMIVIECKSESQRSQRSETQMNRFAKYREELSYNCQWIANNLDEFRQLLTNKNFKLPENLTHIIPMVVGTFVEPYKDANIISIGELDEILEQIPESIAEPELKIVLGGNSELKLPVLRVRSAK